MASDVTAGSSREKLDQAAPKLTKMVGDRCRAPGRCRSGRRDGRCLVKDGHRNGPTNLHSRRLARHSGSAASHGFEGALQFGTRTHIGPGRFAHRRLGKLPVLADVHGAVAEE
jgi:hypothetical protein